MKKNHLIAIITSLCLAVSIIAGSIDYSFLNVDAQMEDTSNKVSESPEKDIDNMEETSSEHVEEIPIEITEPVETTEIMESVVETMESVGGENTSVEDTESITSSESSVEDKPTEDLSFSLITEGNGLKAEFFNGYGFSSKDIASITKLSKEDTKKFADGLSNTLDGQTAVPVTGFILDGHINDRPAEDDEQTLMENGVLDVKVTCNINEGTRLYRCSEGGYEVVRYTLADDGRLVFQTTLPSTYILVDVEYTKKPVTFTYSDDSVTVTAVCAVESNIPANAEFHADKLEEGTDAYNKAYEAVLATMELGENEELLFAPYDVYFICNGKRVEPETGMVQVSMEFHDDVLTADSEDDVLGDLFGVHIKEDGEVEKPDTKVSESSVDFEVDTFSVMGAAAVSRASVATPAYAILYSDGTMVFQRGNTPDSSHGTVVKSWTGFETNTYSAYNSTPWYSSRAQVFRIYFKDSIKPISTAYWFYYFTKCMEFDLTLLDTSSVTDMHNMFQGCSMTSLDLSNFDTRSVTNMNHMFEHCTGFKSLDLSNFNTSAVTDMGQMFDYCTKLESLNLSNFNTSAVTNMYRMFGSCTYLTTLDLSSFNTCSVTNMSSMFSSCTYLKSLNMSNFDTRSVTTMNGMFYNCESIEVLDVSHFDTSSVVNMSNMFYVQNDKGHLTSIDVSHFDTSKVTSMNEMFHGQKLLSSLDVSHFDTSQVTTMDNMFSGCSKLTSLDVSHFDTRKVIDMSGMFFYCSQLTSLDVSHFDTSHVTDMSNMFGHCSSLTSLDVSHFNTSYVTNMAGMFSTISLTHIDLSNFDTTLVTDMGYMFMSCNNLSSLNISHFDTSQVTDMGYMFSSCTSLTDLDVSHFDTSQVTDMAEMFRGCRNLKSLALSNFNTKKLWDMDNMFNGCSSLKSLDVSNFDTGYTRYIDSVFTGCSSLSTIVLGADSVKNNKFLNYSVFKMPWYNIGTGVLYDNLYASYTGGAMAGTYSRPVSITFDSIYGNTQTISSYIGATINTLPDEPTSKFRHFDGWFTEKKGGKQLFSGGTIESDTYYAHWTDYSYNLVLKPNGGDGKDILNRIGYYESYQLPGNIFNWPGKEFIGWNTRKNGSGQSYAPTDFVRGLSSEDGSTVILYAQYSDSEDLVSITFEMNGGIAVPSMTVIRGSTVTFPDGVRPHYTFNNWSTDAEGQNQITKDGYTASNDVTLYAQWYKNPIVTFDTQGMGDNTEQEVRYNTTIGNLPVYPTNDKRSCSLIGWFTEPAGGTQITSATKVTEDTTFYAHWGWKPEFNTNGGKFTGTETYPMQDGSSLYVIEKLPIVSRDGYEFTGWRHAATNTVLTDGCTVDLSKGSEIIAEWQQKSVVTVDFYTDPNKLLSSYICFTGESLDAFPNPTRPSKSVSGYGTVYADFGGWMDASGKFYTPSDVFTQDTKLTAQWIWKDVILTFDADGGSGISGTNITNSKMCVPTGSTLFTLPGAKKTNYVLEGWYTGKNGTGNKLTTDTIITENTIYYANWVSFFLNGSNTTSLYNYGVEWSNASNTNMTNLDNVLEMHPSSTSTQTASMHLRFEINKTVESSESLILPVGSVKIRVPKYIWKDWDGNNTGGNNLSSNLPKYPNVRNGMYFSYMEDGDDYVLINSVEISGTAGLDLTISYTVSPANVRGGASDMNGRYVEDCEFYRGNVPVEFTIDSDLDGTPDSETTKNLAVEMHTTGTIRGSKNGSVLYQWDSSWGQEPADVDDYFYIEWKFSNTRSGVQSFINLRYEETGYHDGTIAYQNNSIVVTKHPKSLLEDAPSTGITLTNTAAVYGTLKSGYEKSQIIKGTITVYAAKYSVGEYSKKHLTSGTNASIKNGGQEDILDDKRDVSLAWSLSYSGGSNSAPIWDENAGTYHVDERTIRIRDGANGDVMYSSGSASSPYVWEPSTGNILLADNDYYFQYVFVNVNEYDSKVTDGAWEPGFINTDYNSQDGFDLYVRRAGSDTFTFYGHYKAQSDAYSIYFTDTDIAGFEIRHNSKYYETDIDIEANMILKPTNHVRMLLQDDVNIKASSVIKNSSVCDIWKTSKGEDSIFFHVVDNTGGNTAANKNCYALNVSKTTQYSKKITASQTNTVFDVMRGTQDTPIWIGAYNYNNSSRKKSMRSGVFYDLLPEGTSVDPDTVFGIPVTNNSRSTSGTPNSYNSLRTSSSKIDPGYFDVRFVQNWENSGRTMMVITYGLPDNYPATTGMGFYYLLHNTYENVMERGTTVENDVAFVNTTINRTPPDSISGTLSTVTQKMYYQSLEDENTGNIGYAKANTNYIPVDAYSWGFNKSVQTKSEYEYLGEVLPNNLYTYRLVYSQSEYATSKGLVFFDVLEGGSDTKAEDGTVQHNDSEWYGMFQYVNTGAASSKLTDGSTTVHCKPVVYYSTKARDAFVASDWNVNNTATWTATKPTDDSKITAVAIDCSKNEDGTDFVMKGKQSLDMYITMRAPVNAENVGKTTYNEGVIWAIHETDDDPTPEYDNAAVIIRDVEPELHKSSDPVSGTESNPTDVYEDDELDYIISVKNVSDQFTLNDIVIEDTIPDGLNIDYTDIKVHFGDPENALRVNISPRVKLVRSGRKLTFTVSSLLPGETAYIVVPTIVITDNGIITNTSHITSVNGVNKTVDSETTWHEAHPTIMGVKKTGVDGLGLAGAKMQLLDSNGTIVSEWVSTGKTEHFDVKPGEYTIHEVEAPEGYLLADDVHVTLARNGFTYVDGEHVSPVLVSDDYTKVLVDKKGQEDEDVVGAKLEIYEIPESYGTNYDTLADDIASGKLGTAVYVWEHVETKEVFGVLKSGGTYALYESEAPEGYQKAAPVVFTVNTDGTEQTVSMLDPYVGREIRVLKYGETEDNPLSGASMAVYHAKKHIHDYIAVMDGYDIDWNNTSNGSSYKFVQDGNKWTSNNKGKQSSTATSTWTIILEEDTDVTLKYKVSSESGYDKFTLKLDSTTLANAISGAGSELTSTKTLTAGTHTLTATYTKDSSADRNDDCAYVILDGVHTAVPTGVWRCSICGNEVTDEAEAVNGPAYEPDLRYDPIQWTSSNEAQVLSLGKGTYILREEAAPRGWAVHADIPFSVTDEGKVKYELDGTVADELIMIDERSNDEPLTSDLSVIKTVQGNMGDKMKVFRFKLVLDAVDVTEITVNTRNEAGEIVSGTEQLTNGSYEFGLAHEGWISFTLPQGINYTITELGAEENGYRVESTNAEGVMGDVNIAAQFINTKRVGIPTGFTAMTSIAVVIVVISGIIIVLINLRKSRKRRQ